MTAHPLPGRPPPRCLPGALDLYRRGDEPGQTAHAPDLSCISRGEAHTAISAIAHWKVWVAGHATRPSAWQEGATHCSELPWPQELIPLGITPAPRCHTGLSRCPSSTAVKQRDGFVILAPFPPP